jgi:hypothetical protein
MATRKVDRVQRLKDEIIKLPEAEQVKLFVWLEAVRDVRTEDARLKSNLPVADTPKESSKS